MGIWDFNIIVNNILIIYFTGILFQICFTWNYGNYYFLLKSDKINGSNLSNMLYKSRFIADS